MESVVPERNLRLDEPVHEVPEEEDHEDPGGEKDESQEG